MRSGLCPIRARLCPRSCQLVEVSGTQLHLPWTLWTTPQSRYQASTATVYHQNSKVNVQSPGPGSVRIRFRHLTASSFPHRLIRVGRIGSFTPSRHPPILFHPPRENTIPTPALPGPINTDRCLSCDRRPHPHRPHRRFNVPPLGDCRRSHFPLDSVRSSIRPCRLGVKSLSTLPLTRTPLKQHHHAHSEPSPTCGLASKRSDQPRRHRASEKATAREFTTHWSGGSSARKVYDRIAHRGSATRPITNPRYTSALTLLSRRCRGLGAPRFHRCRLCLYLTRHENPSPGYLRFPLSRVHPCARTLGIGRKPDPRHLLLADLRLVASFPSLANLLDRCSSSGADHPILDRA